ncbi:MAG: sulfotransferase family protein [Acidimicrobiales bacterium]
MQARVTVAVVSGGGNHKGRGLAPTPRQRVVASVRRVQYEVTKYTIRDHGPPTVTGPFVNGSGRSGTTWLMQLVDRHRDYRILFEPMRPSRVPELGGLPEFPYVRPDDADPALLARVELVLSGQVRNWWIDSQCSFRIYRKRLVKDIRAMFMIGWLARSFPDLRVIHVLRAPVAVAASRQRLGPALGFPDNLDRVLSQTALVDDHFGGDIPLIDDLEDPFERHVAMWSIENLVALRQLRCSESLVMYYESLRDSPAAEGQRVLQFLGQQVDEAYGRMLHRPSSMAGAQAAPPQPITPAKRARCAEIVEVFGLGQLYAGHGSPSIAPQAVFELDAVKGP